MKIKAARPQKGSTRFSVKRSDKIAKKDFFGVLRKVVSTRKAK